MSSHSRSRAAAEALAIGLMIASSVEATPPDGDGVAYPHEGPGDDHVTLTYGEAAIFTGKRADGVLTSNEVVLHAR